MHEPAPAPLIDIGANLGHESFATDLAEVLERAAAIGITHLMVTGTSPESSERAVRLAQQYPALLSATAGIHPHEARHCDIQAFSCIEELSRLDCVIAVGETGLDFNRDFSPRVQQEYVFEQHLELAANIGKPVFLHQRDAHARFLPIVKSYRDALHKGGVVHCFTGEKHELYDYLDMDMYIGITGWICDERRGAHLLEFLKDIPQDRLLLETDAPYLLPRTLRPRPSSRRNEPAFLAEVLRVAALAVGKEAAELARETTANAKRLFALA